MFSAINALLLRPMPLIRNRIAWFTFSQFLAKQDDHDAACLSPIISSSKKASTLEGLARRKRDGHHLGGR